MRKFKMLFVLLIACLLVVPFAVFADGEEEENATEVDSKAVNVYFFRGEGCPHCQEFEEWLESIDEEYGYMINPIDYETWYNEDNQKLMEEVAKTRGETAEGVPYIIVGNKSWNGFASDMEEEILNEIKTLYDKDPSERYDIKDYVELLPGSTPKAKGRATSNTNDILSICIIVLVVCGIGTGVFFARKKTI